MKKRITMLLIAGFFTASLFAQEGGGRGFGGMRRTVAERVADIHKKFDSTFHFATDKQAKVDSAFADFYRSQDRFREEMRANATPGQQPSPEAMQAAREKMQEFQVARDEKLQGILSEDEYKKWKNELEPSMRPQRRREGGGAGNGGNG
jgi:periplasmic protein CpxP/Spy